MLQQEQSLIKKAKRGDIDSFEQLIREHQQFAYNVAFQMLGNREDAKDATQDALVKVFQNMSTYKGNGKFSTWLYRVIVNTCKDQIKKNKPEIWAGEEVHLENMLQAGSEDNPVSAYETAELNNCIRKALRQVPEPFQTAVTLRDMQGLSYNDIAEVEEASLGTIRSRIYRGRALIRPFLKKCLSVKDVYSSDNS